MMKKGLVIAAVVASGCGLFKLDHGKIEKSIQAEVKAKGVDLTSVTCPSRPIKKGDTFDCDGVDTDGQKLVFHVDQTDDKGSISWKLDGMIINQRKVGDDIEKKVGATADVQCPEKAVILKVGESFTCDVVMADGKHKVTLTLSDSTGTVAWRVPN